MKKIFKIFINLFITAIFFTIIFLAYKTKKNSCWNSQNNFNLFISSSSSYIYSYHPSQQVLNIIKLPQNLYLPSAQGYGEYKLKNIYRLGKVENISAGRLIQKSLQNFFLVPIDGYLIDNLENKDKNLGLDKGSLYKILLQSLKGGIDSNLSWWDIVRITNSFRKLNINSINLIDLQETNLYQKEQLADGTQVARLETSLIDDFVQKYFSDAKVLQEGYKISIYNATSHHQLAELGGRLIKNISGQVILSDNADQQNPNSVIYYKQQEIKNSYTIKEISTTFEINNIKQKKDISPDIVVILGKDYLKNFYQK